MLQCLQNYNDRSSTNVDSIWVSKDKNGGSPNRPDVVLCFLFNYFGVNL